MPDKRKPYNREKLIERYRLEIRAILTTAFNDIDKILIHAKREYIKLENKNRKNANRVRSLILKKH